MKVKRARSKTGRGAQIQAHRVGSADIVAIWGGALRSRTARSQDESRRGAIHKQRPYQFNRKEAARRRRYGPSEVSGWDWGMGLPLWRRGQLSRVVKVRDCIRSM